MKKYVKSSSTTHPEVERLDNNAVGSGYTISGDIMNIKVTADKDADKMPKITVKSVEENGKIYFEPHVSFPDLDYSDMDYVDSFEYWLDKYASVGKLLTYLMKASIDPNAEYED